MPSYLENFGLDFLAESEESIQGIMGYTAQNGKAIFGYYGMPYLLMDYGDAQMIARVVDDPETGNHILTGMDTHGAGPCIWKARVSSININRKDADLLQKRIVVNKEDGTGMAVVNLINADVLPSFMDGDPIEMQMIGLPVFLQYFRDEDEYAESVRDKKTGKCFMLSEGTVFPSGMLQNRDPNGEHFEENEDNDDMMLVRGTVKKLYHGIFQMGDVKQDAYIRCFIDTEFGPLELAHTFEQVEEACRSNIRVGSIVNCVCVLSGDVAIHEYENGIVLDEKHDLALLRSVFSGDDPRRLGSALDENVVFTSESNGKQYCGKQAVMDRIKTVNNRIKDDPENKCFAHYATITEILEEEDALPYGVGTRCLVLAYGEPENYEGIAFIELDDSGTITALSISTNSRYRFCLDPKPIKKSVWDDFEIPENVVDPMLARAKFNELVAEDVTAETLLKDETDDRGFRDNAQRMLDLLPDEELREERLKNLFGYLTAKAAESEHNYRKSVDQKQGCQLARYSPMHAWAGEYDSLLDGDIFEKLKDLMETGKLFYNDYSFLCEMRQLSGKEREDMLFAALVFAQKIGKHYAQKLPTAASTEEGS